VPPGTIVKMGDVRRAVLTNTGGGNHPFHIHVNPFQVEGDKIDPNGPNDPSNWRFWDTILVPNQGTVNTRSRYLNYDGEFVFHCHILIHEDTGMMWKFTVDADPANGYRPVAPCTPVTQCQRGRPPAKS
jgi:FtsP/CotA-like multicopper oxidase with cupredoxin domain